MKKFIIICSCLLVLAALVVYGYFGLGIRPWFMQNNTDQVAVTFVQNGKTIYKVNADGAREPFEIKGVDLGSGQPGNFATDYAIPRDTYIRWFQQIKDMGANTIRIYTVLGSAFYEAFYEYNKANPDPLYLIHGVWLNDYANFSHMSGFDSEYVDIFKEDIRTMLDVIHGQRPIELGRLAGTGTYTKDISPWVIGFILGIEWEPSTVVYTNLADDDKTHFEGEYLYTEEGTQPFLNMLAEVGNEALRYETDRYQAQHLVAFSNWPQTDPNEFPELIEMYLNKYASLDVELVHATDKVKSGMFASYHVSPYHPDFLRYLPEYATQTDASGNVNTYYAYLKLLNDHHQLPVVIAEFGIPSSRGRSSVDANTYRSQGGLSETEQAYALAQCYKDIKDAGCAGCIIFSWQDEWFKRSWNTWANVDLLKVPLWSDYQTSEQSYGLLTFDPGKDRSVSYVDGDDEEWTEADIVEKADGGSLSVKYDEKFVYFMVRGENIGQGRPLYLPIDVSQTLGSTTACGLNVTQDVEADLLAAIADETVRAEVERILQGDSDITLRSLNDAVAKVQRVRKKELTVTADEVSSSSYQLALALLRSVEKSDALKSALDTVLEFDRAADFLLIIDGEDNSRLLVQERYEVLRATSLSLLTGENPYTNQPEKDSNLFKPIYQALETLGLRVADNDVVEHIVDLDLNNLKPENIKYRDVYETGKLTYGNANPNSEAFNSLADFMFGDGFVEIRIPWQLLNFSNPSEMQIHDDYYENYGVENRGIDALWVGMGDGSSVISLQRVALHGWGSDVNTHERLKLAYYLMQDIWTDERTAEEVLVDSPLGKVDKGREEAESYFDTSVASSLIEHLFEDEDDVQ